MRHEGEPKKFFIHEQLCSVTPHSWRTTDQVAAEEVELEECAGTDPALSAWKTEVLPVYEHSVIGWIVLTCYHLRTLPIHQPCGERNADMTMRMTFCQGFVRRFAL